MICREEIDFGRSSENETKEKQFLQVIVNFVPKMCCWVSTNFGFDHQTKLRNACLLKKKNSSIKEDVDLMLSAESMNAVKITSPL